MAALFKNSDRGQVVNFQAIRSDWYEGNELMPRLIGKVVRGERRFIFRGFPTPWLPLFIYFDLDWGEACTPKTYVPIFSDLQEGEIFALCSSAKKNGQLRLLVETTVTLDPLMADCLYILDNRLPIEVAECFEDPIEDTRSLRITNWQSYGRPSVRRLEREIGTFRRGSEACVMLPCARKRPYFKSRTHKTIYAKLRAQGVNIDQIDKIVLTSIGVLPEVFWKKHEVQVYDTGVPDIYRLLRLTRQFFKVNRYDIVYDTLNFPPYSDILRVVAGEGLIAELIKMKFGRRTSFYVR